MLRKEGRQLGHHSLLTHTVPTWDSEEVGLTDMPCATFELLLRLLINIYKVPKSL